jgi:prepilin-type N-terminal cleavage/methylation domain-containing protein
MKNQKGFTLLEVLVSIILFAIGILGTMALEVLATRGAVIGSNNITANYLAASLANELETLPVTDSRLSTGSHGYGYTTEACLSCSNCANLVDSTGACGTTSLTPVYQITWTVTPVTTAGSNTTNNLLSIAITVSWAGGNFTLTLPQGHY